MRWVLSDAVFLTVAWLGASNENANNAWCLFSPRYNFSFSTLRHIHLNKRYSRRRKKILGKSFHPWNICRDVERYESKQRGEKKVSTKKPRTAKAINRHACLNLQLASLSYGKKMLAPAFAIINQSALPFQFFFSLFSMLNNISSFFC
jgi:hypothetical protein